MTLKLREMTSDEQAAIKRLARSRTDATCAHAPRSNAPPRSRSRRATVRQQGAHL